MSAIGKRLASRAQKSPRDSVSALYNLSRRPLKNNLSSSVAAFGAQINNPVSLPYKLGVMLHDNDGTAIVHHMV